MNQTVVVAGINHFDPLGREKIINLLNKLRIKKNFIPDCIAVEWDEIFAKIIRNQRDNFIKLASGRNLGLSNYTLRNLADAMVYEADSHLDIYPNLPILWLDKRYEKTIPDSVKNFSIYRLDIYENFICKLPNDNKNKLEEISKIAWSRCEPSAATERDALFFDILNSEIKNCYKNIFIVVGANHANLNIEGSFVNRLITGNYNTHVFILNELADFIVE